jgi:hypothetical protein
MSQAPVVAGNTKGRRETDQRAYPPQSVVAARWCVPEKSTSLRGYAFEFDRSLSSHSALFSLDKLDDTMLLHPDNPIPRKLKLAAEICEVVVSGKRTCAAIAGPPGIGKTHLVKTILKSLGEPYIEVGGSTASIKGLMIAAYELRHGGVLLLDDADSFILSGSVALLNLLKRLLSPDPVREIVNTTQKAMDDKDSVPARFFTRCGLILLTNIDIESKLAIKPRMREHVGALLSRGLLPITLSFEKKWVLDYILLQITEQNLLRNLQFRYEVTLDALQYLCANAWHLKELSVRCAIEIAKYRKDFPDTWREHCARLLLDPPTGNTVVPVPDLLIRKNRPENYRPQTSVFLAAAMPSAAGLMVNPQ